MDALQGSLCSSGSLLRSSRFGISRLFIYVVEILENAEWMDGWEMRDGGGMIPYLVWPFVFQGLNPGHRREEMTSKRGQRQQAFAVQDLPSGQGDAVDTRTKVTKKRIFEESEEEGQWHFPPKRK